MDRSSGMGLNFDQGFRPMGQGQVFGGGGGGGGAGPLPYGQTFGGYTAGLQNQKDIAAGQEKSQQGIARTAADASMYPATLAQGRFNQVFPYVTGQISALQNQLGAPGQAGTPPKIDAAPIWTPSQVQGQVNSQVAGNDAQTASNIRQNSQSVAGRGFGGRSPLLSELTAQSQGQGMQANNQVRQAVPFNAAQGNAQQLLAGQQAQQGQFQSGEENQIQRQQIASGQRSALLSALSNLAR
jgi:hypothetical protein